MFYCKTHYLYLPITFSGFLSGNPQLCLSSKPPCGLSERPCGCSPNIILKPLVIEKPDLFFNGIAHAYFVNISVTVIINL